MLIKVFPGLASKIDQICQISRSYVLKILSYAQKTFFLHINEETLALSHLSAACFVLMGMVILYLEAKSVLERIYLYLFPYNVSLGIYSKSN